MSEILNKTMVKLYELTNEAIQLQRINLGKQMFHVIVDEIRYVDCDDYNNNNDKEVEWLTKELEIQNNHLENYQFYNKINK